MKTTIITSHVMPRATAMSDMFAQLCFRWGAEVFVTASEPNALHYLRNAEHIARVFDTTDEYVCSLRLLDFDR